MKILAGTFVMLTVLAVAGVPASAEEAGARTALVIVDVQEFYYPGGDWALVDPERAGRNAGRLLERFRENGWLVVHVRHDHEPGGAIHADVQPREGEPIVVKQQVNSFRDTELLEILREHAIESLVICGMQTHMCLEAATRAAADLGFECTVIGDACATRDLTHDGRTVAAADVHAATLATLQAYAKVVDAETYLAR